MMPALVRPGPVEVVGHEVDEIQVVGRPPDIDVIEHGSAGRQRGGEQVAVFWQVDADGRQQRQEVGSLLRVTRVLPSN